MGSADAECVGAGRGGQWKPALSHQGSGLWHHHTGEGEASGPGLQGNILLPQAPQWLSRPGWELSTSSILSVNCLGFSALKTENQRYSYRTKTVRIIIPERPILSGFDPEWRSGVAGHLILSDEDLTSVVQGSWKRLNTLQHYKVRRPEPHYGLTAASLMLCFVSAGTRGSNSCTSCSSHQTHSPRQPWLHGRREWVLNTPSTHTHTLSLTLSRSISLYFSLMIQDSLYYYPWIEIELMKGSLYLYATICHSIFWRSLEVIIWFLSDHRTVILVREQSFFFLCQTVTLLCTFIWNVHWLTLFFLSHHLGKFKDRSLSDAHCIPLSEKLKENPSSSYAFFLTRSIWSTTIAIYHHPGIDHFRLLLWRQRCYLNFSCLNKMCLR